MKSQRLLSAMKLYWPIGVVVPALALLMAIGIPSSSQSATREHIAATRCEGVTLVGHRGTGEGGVRDNTLAALRGGVAGGADALEIDTRYTAPSAEEPTPVWVVNHDGVVRRKVGGKPATREIATASYAQLKHFAPDLLSLDDAIGYAKSTKRMLFIDVKSAQADEVRLADMAALVRKHGMQDRTSIISFYAPLLKRYGQLPERAGKIGLIANRLPAHDLPAYAKTVRSYASTIVLRHTAATPVAVRTLKAAGLSVDVYVTGDKGKRAADMPGAWQRYVEYGADGIVTDRPKAYTAWCSGLQPATRSSLQRLYDRLRS